MTNADKTAVRIAGIANLLLLLAGASCAGHGPMGVSEPPVVSSPPIAGAAVPKLPAPAELAKLPSQTEAERWKQGYSIETSLPNRHNDAPGGGGKKGAAAPPRSASEYTFGAITFSPTWDPVVSTTAKDAAYGTYAFYDMDTFAGTPQIVLGWKTPPDFANLWIGVANFQTNKWQWFPSPAGGAPLTLNSLAPYVTPAGNTYITLLLLGKAEATLNYILVGDPIVPYAYIDSDLPSNETQRIAPLTVNWDCTLSYTVGSTMVGYDFDYNGDGIYDVHNDLGGHYPQIYGPGDYTAILRATDSLGHSSTCNLPFHVINPANQTPTANYTPLVASGNAPLTVNFDASVSSDPDGSIKKYEWDWDGDGVFDFTSASPLATCTFATQGPNSVELRVTDNDLATATTFGAVVCNNGWHYSDVETGTSGIYDHLALVVQGSGAGTRACVAYCSDTGRVLHFVRSSNSNGTAWTGPVTVDGDAVLQAGYSPSLIIEPISQAPYVAYGTYDGNSGVYAQRFCRATTSTGAAWNAPAIVDSGPGLGGMSQLVLCGGKLTIGTIYKDGVQGGASVRIYQATTLAGTMWNNLTTLGSALTGEQLSQLRLLVPTGQLPLAMWTSFTDNIGARSYEALASAADGSAWGTASELTSLEASGEDFISLAVVGGQPALAMGTISSGGKLFYDRSDNAAGSSWTTPPTVLDSDGTVGVSCSMALVNGIPAIAYGDSTRTGIRYAVALDPNGTAWNSPQEVDSAGYLEAPVALGVMANNVPLVVYYDLTHSKVKAAAFY